MSDTQSTTQKDTQNTASNKPVLKDSSDSYRAFLSTKLEKLTSALYLLTSFFPDGDPLQQSIRQKSLELLRLVHISGEGAMGSFSRVSQTIRSLVSELRVAHNVGIISDMNFQVLEEEFSTFQSRLESSQKTSTEPILDRDYFSIPTPEAVESPAETSGKEGRKTQGATRNKARTQSSSSVSQASEQKTASDGSGESPPSRKNGPKKRRRGIIMDILKDKPEVSVKDVTKVIPNYSAKTIQRDLKALVKKGILVKEGKRRWTTYRLAD